MKVKPSAEQLDIFSIRLQIAMNVKDLDIPKLARKIHCNTDSARRWINRQNIPTGTMLLRLANELDVSIDWLLGRTQWMHADRRRP